MTPFEAAYSLWVFTSALGVVQFAAVRSNLHGLVVFRNRPRFTQAASVALVVLSFAWFFASGDRNVPDTGEGLDGVEQARFFAIAGAAAVAVLAAVSSIVNRRWAADNERAAPAGAAEPLWPPEGLDRLERATFASAAAARVRAVAAALRRRPR